MLDGSGEVIDFVGISAGESPTQHPRDTDEKSSTEKSFDDIEASGINKAADAAMSAGGHIPGGSVLSAAIGGAAHSDGDPDFETSSSTDGNKESTSIPIDDGIDVANQQADSETEDLDGIAAKEDEINQINESVRDQKDDLEDQLEKWPEGETRDITFTTWEEGEDGSMVRVETTVTLTKEEAEDFLEKMEEGLEDSRSSSDGGDEDPGPAYSVPDIAPESMDTQLTNVVSSGVAEEMSVDSSEELIDQDTLQRQQQLLNMLSGISESEDDMENAVTRNIEGGDGGDEGSQEEPELENNLIPMEISSIEESTDVLNIQAGKSAKVQTEIDLNNKKSIR